LTVRIEAVLEEVPTKLLRSNSQSLRENLGDLSELKNSVVEHGLLQPILVRPIEDGYEIVAGHRRAEACRELYWRKIPCYIASLSDKEAFEASLVENIQRQTLNALEESIAFKKYVDNFGWGGVSDLARRIGKSPSYVSHSIKLLDLPAAVKDLINSQKLTGSMGSELLWLKDDNMQEELARIAVESKLTLAEMRKEVKRQNEVEEKDEWPSTSSSKKKMVRTRRQEDQFRRKSKVVLRIAMLRLDDVLRQMDDSGYDGGLKECITNKRKALHEMIDTFVKEEVKIKKHEKHKLWI